MFDSGAGTMPMSLKRLHIHFRTEGVHRRDRAEATGLAGNDKSGRTWVFDGGKWTLVALPACCLILRRTKRARKTTAAVPHLACMGATMTCLRQTLANGA